MSTRLILIRHGQSRWNLEKRYSGLSNIGLSENGKKQIEKLRRRLRNEEVYSVYSSDRKRAIDSAEVIFKGQDIKKMPQLRELRFGIFEGLTYQEIMQSYPKLYSQWLNNPFSINIPKGESLNDFKRRTVNAFKEIISLNRGKTAIVVCHGGTISVFVNYILKTNDFWGKIPRCASITVIEYKNGKPQIKLFNDTTHLKNNG